METPSSREVLRETVLELPLLEIPESSPILGENDALSAWRDLSENGATLPDRIRRQVIAVSEDVMDSDSLESIDDNTFVVTRQAMRSILTRMAIAASTQAVADTGVTMREIKGLTELLNDSVS